MEEKEEIRVKELAGKLKVDEITPKEALKELQKRGLVEHERWEIIPWVIYFILWLPLNFMFAGQLPVKAPQILAMSVRHLWFAIHFPLIVICISIVLSGFGIYLGIRTTRMHYKRGGLKHDETIILFKDGPYAVIRHPAVLGTLILPILLPIILSKYVPFTPLSVTAIIVMIVYMHYGVRLEEKLDIAKWGNEYLQYMKEVPRFNFITGLRNLSKKR